jgi:nitrite reductase/ring-hydroxylating ferredoxin subunit
LLSEARNRLLCETGQGTPMGELLRRYWHPVAGAAEFSRQSVKAVRVLGEDLALYRDKGGNYGLVDRHCPHRRADMTYGFTEERGLRCNYHGWLFDHTGQCLDQPFEETLHPEGRFKEVTPWADAGFAPSDAVDARDTGVPLAAAVAWRRAGFILPDAALLIRDGWTLGEAVSARYAGIAREDRQPG